MLLKMKSFVLIVFLSPASEVYAIFNGPKNAYKSLVLDPSEVGLIHDDAFQTLSQKYAGKIPNSRDEIVMDMSAILYEFCPEKSNRCRLNADEAIAKAIDDYRDGPVALQYPRNMDIELKTALDKMFTAVNLLGKDNVDTVIGTVNEIKVEIEQMQHVNYFHKWLGLAAASVAVQSTKLWYDVFYNPTHPLRSMFVEKEHAGDGESSGPEWDWLDDRVDECELVLGAGIGIAVQADIVGIFSAVATTAIRAVLIAAAFFIPAVGQAGIPFIIAGEIINAFGIVLWIPFVSISYSTVAILWSTLASYICDPNADYWE